MGELGVTNEFKDVLLEDRVKVKFSHPGSDLLRHPADLFEEDTLAETPIYIRKSSKSAINPWKQNGNPGLNWQPNYDLSFMYGQLAALGETMITKREAAEEYAAKTFIFRTGVEHAETLVIELPQGCMAAATIPPIYSEISSPMRFSDLSENERKSLWDRAVVSFFKHKSDNDALLSSQKQGQSAGNTGTIPPR